MDSYGQVQMVPAWQLERPDLVFQYNEYRDYELKLAGYPYQPRGWYQVSYWQDDRWSGRFILPGEYSAAGIV